MIVLEARDRVGGRVLNGADSEAVTTPSWAARSRARRRTASRRWRPRSASRSTRPTTPATTSSGRTDADSSTRTTLPWAPRRRIRSWPATSRRRSRSSTRWRSRFPSTAPGTHPTRRSGTGRRSTRGFASTSSGSDEFMALVSAATEAIFGCEPRELSLLYTLFYIAASGNEQNPGTFERNFNTTGGAQQRRFAGGAARVPERVAAALGSQVGAERARALDLPDGKRGDGRLGRRDRDRRARDRRDPADARRPHRLRPAAAGAARPAHAAHAAGDADEVRGDLPDAVLAREGPERPGRQRERAGQGDLRRLALGRHARDHDGLHRGARRARAGRTDRRTSCATRRSRTSPTTSATRRSARRRS